MYLSQADLRSTSRIKRLNIVNGITGIKPGNLIGTKSNDGTSNLAIFSSIVHLASNPGFLGFMIRPDKKVRRHTYENILENGCFTVNHIHTPFVEKAHYTSAKFEKEISEFDACGLTEEYQFGFQAPFVKESTLKMALKHVESVRINATNTTMIVGEIQHLIIPDHAIDEHGFIDLSLLDDVGISGLNCYYALKKIKELPYARPNELPNFTE